MWTIEWEFYAVQQEKEAYFGADLDCRLAYPSLEPGDIVAMASLPSFYDFFLSPRPFSILDAQHQQLWLPDQVSWDVLWRILVTVERGGGHARLMVDWQGWLADVEVELQMRIDLEFGMVAVSVAEGALVGYSLDQPNINVGRLHAFARLGRGLIQVHRPRYAYLGEAIHPLEFTVQTAPENGYASYDEYDPFEPAEVEALYDWYMTRHFSFGE